MKFVEKKSRARVGPLVPFAALFLALGPQVHASESHPNFYTLAKNGDFGSWASESRILVDWKGDTPIMTGLECLAEDSRKGILKVRLRHPVESSQFDYAFEFTLPDGALIDRRVETVGVGGRTYRFKREQVRIIPWFGVYGPDEVVLTYGLGRAMVRPDETYPWTPIEFLMPQFFEAEEVRIGISGKAEIKHGDYETRYEEIDADMDGFKEAMNWCFDQVNPSGKKPALPAELQKKLKN
ncbi:hypothetical protein [Sphingopyxis sp.]|uniref:hypothetical protein n=1 Tax=Sphingopyxis sp. TaxID=1908224 RepID=UPI00258EC83A|nr:hypothetical protein [Sphingopyxis sp.]